jgi:hypothetical protein
MREIELTPRQVHGLKKSEDMRGVLKKYVAETISELDTIYSHFVAVINTHGNDRLTVVDWKDGVPMVIDCGTLVSAYDVWGLMYLEKDGEPYGPPVQS